MSNSISNNVTKMTEDNSERSQTSGNEFFLMKSRLDCDTVVGEIET